MTPNQVARELFSRHATFCRHHLTPEVCKHQAIMNDLQELRDSTGFSVSEIGRSQEGRGIHAVTIGQGSKHVLMWSQMHGDEPTATLALMDILHFLTSSQQEKWVQHMLGQLTMHIIPLLNPDGAERVQRRTASGIDMNRDALDLATPEAKLLRDAQRRWKPVFGFNLHDQGVSSVGNTTDVAAMSFLAPALDEKKLKPPVRLKAMRIAALISKALDQFASGHLAAYDDTFEPRAFGDNMQRWGTSTVLLESGHWPNDRQKKFIRKLNYVAILSACHGIASGTYHDVSLEHYWQLPPNGKRVHEFIIKEVMLTHQNGWSHAADIALSFNPTHNMHATPTFATVVDIGDLRTFGALQSINARSRAIPTNRFIVDQTYTVDEVFGALQLPKPLL
jgi:hypothetical protein